MDRLALDQDIENIAPCMQCLERSDRIVDRDARVLPAREVTRGAGGQESRVHWSVSNLDEAVMHAPMLEEE